jgi:hypothetical protein
MQIQTLSQEKQYDRQELDAKFSEILSEIRQSVNFMCCSFFLSFQFSALIIPNFESYLQIGSILDRNSRSHKEFKLKSDIKLLLDALCRHLRRGVSDSVTVDTHQLEGPQETKTRIFCYDSIYFNCSLFYW